MPTFYVVSKSKPQQGELLTSGGRGTGLLEQPDVDEATSPCIMAVQTLQRSAQIFPTRGNDPFAWSGFSPVRGDR